MKYISDVAPAELKGKRVLVRAGLDVPLDKAGNVADLFRIKQAAKTLKFLSDAGARTIVLSHIGRDPSETNEPVARALKAEVPLVYISDLLGAAVEQAIGAMRE